MAKKMQYCFSCGVELGIYHMPFGEWDSCGKKECDQFRRDTDEEVRSEAEKDHYDRYR